MKKVEDDVWTIRERFVHNRNVVSKSLTTLLFAVFMWHGKLRELQGVPANYHYFVVRHSFDTGLLFLIVLLALLGFYVGFSKKHMAKGKAIFLVAGATIWAMYAGLFLYRDWLFPNWPSLQAILVVSIALSFWLDVLAGDF